jgi:hypothetical protein
MLQLPLLFCGLLSLGSADVRLNLGAGPSFAVLPGSLGQRAPWAVGFDLDAAASVPASVARDRAPAGMRSRIPSEGEVDVRPLWLGWIPGQVVASPGGDLSLWGATWDLFGLGTRVPLGSVASLRAHVQFPEFWWLHGDGPATTGPNSSYGLGVAPLASLQLDPWAWIRISGGWTHHVGIPFGSIHLRTGAESPWQWGSAWVMLTLRPPVRI